MKTDTWADPVEQMVATFTKEGLRQACFDRRLDVLGDKRQLAGRLIESGYTITGIMQGKSK